MLGATHDYELLIQEQHLDTFGHVNNAAYLQILEQARWDLVTRNGYGLDEVHRRKIGPVVLEIRLRFRRELRNRQRVTIRSWVESYAGKTGKFEQHILDDAGNAVLRGGVHRRPLRPHDAQADSADAGVARGARLAAGGPRCRRPLTPRS